MSALLSALSLPYLRTNKGRILVTLLGIVIGVQGMVAMAALNRSIVRSFEDGIGVIAGDATLQIAGPETGIPEELAREAESVNGVRFATALVEGSFHPPQNPEIRIAVFGVDFLEQVGKRNPQFPPEHVHIKYELSFLNALDSIALGGPLMRRMNLDVGSRLELVTPAGLRTFTVRGSLDPVGPVKLYDGAVALLDLPNAQRLLLAPGLVQTIYVTVDPEADHELVRRALETVIGPRARVEATSIRGEQFGALLGSLRVALWLASLVTMIVAFFIIYQTMAISVDQRRRDIAIARALGFTRRSVVSVFLLEALALGVLGALGGVIGGYVLARMSLTTALAGVSDMYAHVATASLSLPLGETLVGVSLGITTCVLAGVAPAFRAASDSPVAVLRSATGVQASAIARLPLAFGTASVACAIAILSTDLRLSTPVEKTVWIMLGHGSLLAGASLCAPAFVALVAHCLMPVGRRATLVVDLATDFFSRRPQRAAATASAIMVGYALVVVLGAVVHSITGTLRVWLDRTFDSGLMVGTAPGLASATFEVEIATRLANLDGVLAVERYRKTLLSFEEHPIVLATFDRRNRPDGSPLVVTRTTDDAYARAERGEAALVSESFSFRYGYDIGDTIVLSTTEGVRPFEISAIVRDYTFDLGTVFVDADVYRRLWHDSRLTYAKLWTRPDVALADVRSAVARAITDVPQISLVTNVEFRREVETRVHGLLRVLGSLQLFASTIAVLSVVNLLLASILDRRREISLLRSVGVTRRQIRSAVIVEAGLMGMTGATLGLITGSVGAFFMVKHSLRIDMGWSLDFRFPVVLALSTMLLTTLAAAAAGYLPARRITAGKILPGLQME